MQKGEIVIAVVKEIRPHSVLVDIVDYPGEEGMIHISEIASGWIKNIRNHVRVGQQVVCKIMRKGYPVNLSMKRVSEREKKEKLKQFSLEKRAEKLFEMLVESGVDKKWKVEIRKEFGSLWNAFETAFKNPGLVEKRLPEIADRIIDIARKNIKKKEVEIKYEIDIHSTEGDGIERVKKALKPFEKKYDIIYLSAGRFMLSTRTTDPKKVERKLEEELKQLEREKGCIVGYKRVEA